MKTYRTKIEAEFLPPAKSSEEIRKKLLQLIKQAGFDEKNFEIAIELAKAKE